MRAHRPILYPHKYNSERRTSIFRYFKKRKNGAAGTRVHYIVYDITPLNKCDLCNRISTPKNINYRPVPCYSSGKSNMIIINLDYLCMSCWNKQTRLANKEKDSESLRKLINKLKKEVTNAKRIANKTA